MPSSYFLIALLSALYAKQVAYACRQEGQRCNANKPKYVCCGDMSCEKVDWSPYNRCVAVTGAPTAQPTHLPTFLPTFAPITLTPTTLEPTGRPSNSPTDSPTLAPTDSPTFSPTLAPTTPSPTSRPTLPPVRPEFRRMPDAAWDSKSCKGNILVSTLAESLRSCSSACWDLSTCVYFSFSVDTKQANCLLLKDACGVYVEMGSEPLLRATYRRSNRSGKMPGIEKNAPTRLPTLAPTVVGSKVGCSSGEKCRVLVSAEMILGLSIAGGVAIAGALAVYAFKNGSKVKSGRVSRFIYALDEKLARWVQVKSISSTPTPRQAETSCSDGNIVERMNPDYTRDDYLRHLIMFYEEHNPDKVSGAENILDQYRGKELKMFQKLAKKYECANPLHKALVHV